MRKHKQIQDCLMKKRSHKHLRRDIPVQTSHTSQFLSIKVQHTDGSSTWWATSSIRLSSVRSEGLSSAWQNAIYAGRRTKIDGPLPTKKVGIHVDPEFSNWTIWTIFCRHMDTHTHINDIFKGTWHSSSSSFDHRFPDIRQLMHLPF